MLKNPGLRAERLQHGPHPLGAGDGAAAGAGPRILPLLCRTTLDLNLACAQSACSTDRIHSALAMTLPLVPAAKAPWLSNPEKPGLRAERLQHGPHPLSAGNGGAAGAGPRILPLLRPKPLNLNVACMQSACSTDRIHSALATALPLVPGLAYFRFCASDPRCGIALDEIDPEQVPPSASPLPYSEDPRVTRVRVISCMPGPWAQLQAATDGCTSCKCLVSWAMEHVK